MGFNRLIFILFCIIFLDNIKGNKEIEEVKEEIFVATKEWQLVKKGQKIPKGLHVRINFETGVTEAKLLDENENTDSKINAVAVQEKIDYLESIGNIKSKKKFKSYKEIKDDLDFLNIKPMTDAEILNELFFNFKTATDDRAIIEILENMENLAHQYDNALEFIRLKGFETVISINLNSTNEVIRIHTLHLIGALCQNNPKVQIKAVESGVLNTLIRIIGDKASPRSKAIFALGTIIRRFPYSQNKFMEYGGLLTLIDILDSNDLSLMLRVVTLLNDLLVEETEGNAAPNLKINLKEKLLELSYCRYLNDLFINLYLADKDDLYSAEKGLMAINEVIDDCQESFSGDFYQIISTIKAKLIDNQENDVIVRILEKLGNNVHKKKDEL